MIQRGEEIPTPIWLPAIPHAGSLRYSHYQGILIIQEVTGGALKRPIPTTHWKFASLCDLRVEKTDSNRGFQIRFILLLGTGTCELGLKQNSS